MSLKLKTEPMAHQQKVYDAYKGVPYFALFWDQGTGKTKGLIDHVAYAYHQKVVNCLVVIAPNGVHANWVNEELPKHMSVPYEAFTYYNSMGKKWENDLVDFIDSDNHKDVLKVVCFPMEGFSHAPKQRKTFEYVLDNHTCYGVVDESDDIGNYKANRTKYLLGLAHKFRVRRIATGTPVDAKPLAAWTQLQFLSPKIFNQDYFSFRARYSIMRDKVIKIGSTERIQKFPVAHRNLDKLHDIIASVSDRVLKEECMDLPEKVYQTIPLQMSKEQQRYYNDMMDRAFYLIEESDDLVYAKNALDMMGKLSRITGGFVEKGVPCKTNPKMKWLVSNIEKYTVSADVIIWCGFRDEIAETVKQLGSDQCVSIHGDIVGKEREEAVDSFKNDADKKILVTNKCMSRGFTLINARTNIFYSNRYSLRDRRQMEDRTHRRGQEGSCLNIDLVCENSIDEYVLDALKKKKDVAELVMGDETRDWIKTTRG